MRKIKRFMILALAIVLLCGAALPAHAYGLFGGGKKPKPGERVEITAPDRSSEGLVFDHWEANTDKVVFNDPYSPNTWFIVPDGVKDIDINPMFRGVTPVPTIVPTPVPTPEPTAKPDPVMKSDAPDNPYKDDVDFTVLGNSALKRSAVCSIEFVNSLNEAGSDAWDVSEAGDRSVLAWTRNEGSGKRLIIGGEGGVKAPKNSRFLFAKYTNLENIDFNSCFLTGETTDMYGLFMGCEKLHNLDLQGLDTRNVTRMSNMFQRCSGLTGLNLHGLNTENVENMSEMFDGCSGLYNLDLSDLDTHSVDTMGGMFSGCSGLSSLDVSSFDTRNVTYMGAMFSGCSNLRSLNIRGLDTRNVTSMYGMFSGCSSLSSIDVSSFDTRNVTAMSSMFYHCDSLTSLDVSRFDTRNVTDMTFMFYRCMSLSSLDVSSFDMRNVTRMGGMFRDCSNLTSVNLGSFDMRSVTDTDLSDAFFGCYKLDVSRIR